MTKNWFPEYIKSPAVQEETEQQLSWKQVETKSFIVQKDSTDDESTQKNSLRPWFKTTGGCLLTLNGQKWVRSMMWASGRLGGSGDPPIVPGQEEGSSAWEEDVGLAGKLDADTVPGGISTPHPQHRNCAQFRATLLLTVKRGFEKVQVSVALSCLSLCNPMDWS